ncbi:S1C family serine protease [Pseudorhodoplanes sinuspersici]|uniref:Signal protein PDZ n=1 Tax=Pseudorhodoplanes sinuspersici TaxID=1235591 RepID=A0A1W6ZPQ1_9HYPH|nr:S1C family serine protease [Pseudorhodoplanes sinuspersici]ARP98764.1 signal protein PDZ [Pseudorhodoplanes sinuspersici]RKE69623.1 S1-C subfamily serine protease [Pseudorhodoplanes sinuspersici]
MPSTSDWKISSSVQPRPEDYSYDLDRALQSVVGLRATMPADAFTAETLGTERAGHGVVIRDDGLILTIGYLITEADQIWIHLADGRAVPGHALAYDQASGFGLVQALARIDLPALPLGSSGLIKLDDKVVIGGAGGRKRSVAAKVVGKQEFAGYWEYVLDEAIFTSPAHPNWGGTALIGPGGDLVGIGSLQLESGSGKDINMVVPIDLLKPVLDDLLTHGRPTGPVRPWLGFYVADADDRLVVMGLANKGPAQRAKIESGDAVLAVDGVSVEGLADLFRKIWAMGPAGVEVPMTLVRDGQTFEVAVKSSDRNVLLKTPRLH